MMYLYWLLMVPVSLCFTLLALFLAPVLPIFARDASWVQNVARQFGLYL